MKLSRIFSLAAVATLAAIGSAQLAEHVQGQLHVKFAAGQSPAAINSMIGAGTIRTVPQIGWTLVSLPSNMTVQQGLSFYRGRTGVLDVTPNYIARAQWTPNDPLRPQQYALTNIKAYQAWDFMLGSPLVRIAILDTGIDLQHPDLAAKTTSGFDFVNNDNDADDDNGHGTHCAGIAAAITNNGVGVAGCAPLCSLVAVKVLSGGGSGSFDGIMQGITWAADNNCKVISMSLGGGGEHQGTLDAIRYAISKGSVVIAAAGNHGTTQKIYPGGWDECLAVASTNQNDQKSGFSAFGDWVEVAAPGSAILSTFPDNNYGLSDGTSMSTPYVAGQAGLIKSLWMAATPAQIRAQIENNCDFVGSFVTKGRINLFKSIPTFAITDPFAQNVSAISMFEGLRFTGLLADAQTSNNRWFGVFSRMVQRLGETSSSQSTFQLTGTRVPSDITELGIKAEVRAPAGVTASIFLWDNTAAKWVYISSTPMTGVDKIISVRAPAPTGRFWNSTKQLKALVRFVMPVSTTRPPTAYYGYVDHIQVTGRVPKP